MKTLRGFLLSTAVLALGIAIIGEASAQEGRRGRRRQAPPAPQPPVHQDYNYQDQGSQHGNDFYFDEQDYSRNNGFQNERPLRLRERMNRYVYGQETIGIKRLFRLRQYQGHRIKKVIIKGESQRRGQVSLFMGHQKVGRSQFMSYHSNRLVFDVPNYVNSVIGQGVGAVQLKLRGDFYIQRVVVVLERANHRRLEIIERFVNHSSRGHATLRVRQIVGLNGFDHRGKAVKFVSINGNSMRGHGTAQLMLDGYPVGPSHTLGRYNHEVRFNLPAYQQILGEDFRRLQIELRGRINVNKVTVGIKKQRRNGRRF